MTASVAGMALCRAILFCYGGNSQDLNNHHHVCPALEEEMRKCVGLVVHVDMQLVILLVSV